MAKVLFFFTGSYPYGTGETFIESELPFLANTFDKIVIISNNDQDKHTRKTSQNIKLYRIAYELPYAQKLISYRNLFSKTLWREFRTIRNIYQMTISKPMVNTMCQTMEKARFWKKKFNRIIQDESKKTDEVFLYSYWNNDTAFTLAQLKKERPSIKALSRMHGWDVYFEANQINYLPFRLYIFKKLDQVYAISQKGKDYYSKRLPTAQNKISIAHLGVTNKGANPIKKNNTRQLLTVSNIIPIKNLSLLVEALALIDFPFHWTHIGTGPLRNELLQLANILIPNKFLFKGQLTNTEVISYFKQVPIDIFLNVSKSEGIPVSIMEAMSFGVPVIATAVGGTPEIVNNNNGTLLSETPKKEEVANAINDFFFLKREEQEKIRKTAYNTWKEKYNAEKNYSQFTNQILNL